MWTSTRNLKIHIICMYAKKDPGQKRFKLRLKISAWSCTEFGIVCMPDWYTDHQY